MSDVKQWALRANDVIKQGAEALSDNLSDRERIYSQILAGVHDLRPGGRVDNRVAKWAIRIRLYSNESAEPLADTQPDAPPDQVGDWIVDGLPGAAAALQNVASEFHLGTTIRGLDTARLKKGIKGLRPTLSRNSGQAVWRVYYDAADTPWTARIDVTRA